MNFKVGDKVKVVRKPSADELRTWGNVWVDDGMDEYVNDGNEYTIKQIRGGGHDVGVRFEDDEYKAPGIILWSFPPEALELVPDYTIKENITYHVDGQVFNSRKEANDYVNKQRFYRALANSGKFSDEQKDWLYANRGQFFDIWMGF